LAHIKKCSITFKKAEVLRSLLRNFHKGDLMTLLINKKKIEICYGGLSLNFVLNNKEIVWADIVRAFDSYCSQKTSPWIT